MVSGCLHALVAGKAETGQKFQDYVRYDHSSRGESGGCEDNRGVALLQTCYFENRINNALAYGLVYRCLRSHQSPYYVLSGIPAL